MSLEPPPIADPYSTTFKQKVTPSASDLFRSGCKLLGVGISLYVIPALFSSLRLGNEILDFAVLGVAFVAFLAVACFVVGCLRLVRALLVYVRFLTRSGAPS